MKTTKLKKKLWKVTKIKQVRVNVTENKRKKNAINIKTLYILKWANKI